MTILAIDPGTTTSGVVSYCAFSQRVEWAKSDMPNEGVLVAVRDGNYDLLACESIEAMYAHVGKETIRTIRFTGRIEEAGNAIGKPARLLSTHDVKKLVCGTASAKDSAVRQAIIDRLGAPGTKGEKGATYGVTKHAWRALALALTIELNLNENSPSVGATGNDHE
jgi:hypothetical protein